MLLLKKMKILSKLMFHLINIKSLSRKAELISLTSKPTITNKEKLKIQPIYSSRKKKSKKNTSNNYLKNMSRTSLEEFCLILVKKN